MEPCKYKDGEPCSHPGCSNHTTHPCEVCGRINGRYPQLRPDLSSTEELLAYLKLAGITCTSDGLLENFIHTRNYRAAHQSCKDSIKRRMKEIKYLQELSDDLERLAAAAKSSCQSDGPKAEGS